MHRALILALCLATALALAPRAASAQTGPSPETQKLAVSLGRWVYTGTAKSRSGKTTSWTWKADCRWSGNQLFLECSFNNIWGGRPAESLVVDSYNTTDKTYWHYEMFAGGQSGANPFVSKMTVTGDEWIENGPPPTGKRPAERIVYRWLSPTRVTVDIETSTDGTNWTTVDHGVGVKQP